MAYDEQLEERLHAFIAKRNDFHKQKMFGGVGFLLRGKTRAIDFVSQLPRK